MWVKACCWVWLGKIQSTKENIGSKKKQFEMKERQKLEIEMNKCISDHSIITISLSIRDFDSVKWFISVCFNIVWKYWSSKSFVYSVLYYFRKHLLGIIFLIRTRRDIILFIQAHSTNLAREVKLYQLS